MFHAVLQKLRRGQNCEFCYIESGGKNNVTSLIKLQSTSFFLHMEPVYMEPVSFQKNIHDLTKWRPNYYCTLFGSPCIFDNNDCYS